MPTALPERKKADLPTCRRCGNPAALTIEHLHAAAKDLSRLCRQIRARWPREEYRGTLLAQLARNAETLRRREQQGLCSPCASIEQAGARVGSAVGSVVAACLKPEAANILKLLASPREGG